MDIADLAELTVLSVVDKDNLLLIWGDRKPTVFWVSGFPTSGLADDNKVQLQAVLEVVGTKKYETTIGQKTVMWLKPFELVIDK